VEVRKKKNQEEGWSIQNPSEGSFYLRVWNLHFKTLLFSRARVWGKTDNPSTQLERGRKA